MKNENYLQSIYIEELRHLKDINIELSKEEKKHLIITGRNGCGKTTLLDAIANYLAFIKQNRFNFPQDIKEWILSERNHVQRCEDMGDNIGVQRSLNTIKNYEVDYKLETHGILLNFDDQINIINKYNDGLLIICHMNAKRTSSFATPTGVTKTNLLDKYDINTKINQEFIKYMVDLKTQQAYVGIDNNVNIEEQQYYANWFENFTSLLRTLFNDSNLQLIYDYKNYDFKIKLSDGKLFGFNEMSDGYSAVFDIISELMLRMESHTKLTYDLQGIVLIDEIETHLHVQLQKNILPMLTTIFPNIQFIVTTHSPFVLTSEKNAVIYDLNLKERFEDFTKYSYENIVENFFNVNTYSTEILNLIANYENLLCQFETSKDNTLLAQLDTLENYFNNTKYPLDTELQFTVNDLKLRKLVALNG